MRERILVESNRNQSIRSCYLVELSSYSYSSGIYESVLVEPIRNQSN